MRRFSSGRRIIAALSFAAIAAMGCSRTEEGNLQVQVLDVDVNVRRDSVTVPMPNVPDIDVGTKRDTVTTPTVGTRRTEIQRPTVDVKRP